MIDLGYNSTSGQGVRVIGYWIIADDIVIVIVFEHDGTEYGVSGRSANAKARRIYNEGSYDSEDGEGRSARTLTTCSLLRRSQPRRRGPSDPDAAVPADVKVTRGHPRARNLQVRFRDDEFEELREYAEQRGLRVSTVVRTPGSSSDRAGR